MLAGTLKVVAYISFLTKFRAFSLDSHVISGLLLSNCSQDHFVLRHRGHLSSSSPGRRSRSSRKTSARRPITGRHPPLASPYLSPHHALQLPYLYDYARRNLSRRQPACTNQPLSLLPESENNFESETRSVGRSHSLRIDRRSRLDRNTCLLGRDRPRPARAASILI